MFHNSFDLHMDIKHTSLNAYFLHYCYRAQKIIRKVFFFRVISAIVSK